MLTIGDIAKIANVSRTTVSKALNGYTDISEETREKVLSIAQELGYFPSANAKSLITKKSWLVGILFTESMNVGLEHPIFGGVIESFKNTMEESGYDTIFINSSIGIEKASYLHHCRYRGVEGVFVCTFAGEDTFLHELFESEIKCVTTDVDYPGDVPLVISDNSNGIVMAYNYLYDMGHRDIAFISGPQITLSGRERLDGYKVALREKKEPFKSMYIVNANEYDYKSGCIAVSKLMDKCVQNLPTAIIVAGDLIALGAIEALEKRGIRVPEDISVIGFDNIEISKYSKPRLTTIAQDRKRIGELTAEVLLSFMHGEKVDKRNVVPVEIIERETCAPPKNKRS